MLFNSYIFIFLFLPTTLVGFYLIGGKGHYRLAISWLIIASLFFYGWWNPSYLGLILGSMLFNYAMGVALLYQKAKQAKALLTIGIVINLGMLGYFKYANFFLNNLNAMLGKNLITLETIILPLAISFFTFQQIIFLLSAYKGETREYQFLQYALFVTFFPQLIAGPIVRHKEMFPQFARNSFYRFKTEHIAVGITIFAIGLFKKVVLADGIAIYSTPVFTAADEGMVNLTFFEAWGGALSYTLQLYFDFSAYSDMAIGLARMFGVSLPLNFNSPYKATSIIEFWRRWHITLSRFLRDYVYIPLGGSHNGETHRMINLMITMLLGGLWHGAGWTFVLWGGLHGIYLVINHMYRKILPMDGVSLIRNCFGWVITMLAVVVAWVPFRTESFEGAKRMLEAMAGMNGIVFKGMFSNQVIGNPYECIIWISTLIIIAIVFPNTQQWMSSRQIAIETYNRKKTSFLFLWMEWQPNKAWGLLVGFIFLLSILSLSRPSEFLYFQF